MWSDGRQCRVPSGASQAVLRSSGRWGLVGLICFLFSASAEVTGSDDQALFVRSEASPNLLNRGSLDIILRFLFLDLDGHLDADHVTYPKDASDINAAVAAKLGHLDLLEAHLRKQMRDEFLELVGFHIQQTLAKGLLDLLVVVFDLER